jgi:hypothetical protein
VPISGANHFLDALTDRAEIVEFNRMRAAASRCRVWNSPVRKMEVGRGHGGGFCTAELLSAIDPSKKTLTGVEGLIYGLSGSV